MLPSPIPDELVVAEPQSSPHYTAICLVEDALRRAFGEAWRIRPQGADRAGDDSEPESDVAVVAGSVRDYSREHPARPVLVARSRRRACSTLDLHRPQSPAAP